jgi:uncharacterized membrane protein YqjE
MTQTTITPTRDPSLGELVSQLSEHTSRLVKDEIKLAQVEMAAKGKKAGLGVGLFGGAGLFALYGVGCLVAAAVAALALVLPTWAAALIVAGALFVVAAIAALVGKREVSAAGAPVPTEALASIKLDVAAAKRSHA